MKIPCRLLAFAAVFGATAFPLRAAEAPATVPASTAAPGAARLAAGDVAPDFIVLGPKGQTIRLSDFAGKIVIVDVSATWCGPCQAAMPNNDRVFKKYADQGVVLLGVTADDSREAYDGWIKRSEGKYSFLMTFDPAGRAGWDGSVFNTKYHVTGFPTMFVIGRDGKIVETVAGGGPGEDYRLEYALARAGAKVDLASLPPEPKKEGPKSIPAMTKTAAIPAGGMVGMGGGAKREVIPAKFGSVAAGDNLPNFTVTGADGAPVKASSFAGKPLLVHFVSGGMGPQPWFLKVLADYKDANFTTLVVFAATERADFDKWVAANPNPGYRMAWDPAGKAWAEGVTNTSFGVGMFPASLVATADGKLVSGFIGMGDSAATTVKMMLTAARAIKPTEADLAAFRERVQAVMGAGGMTPAAAKPAGGADAPKPPFAEKYGKLKAGDDMPDFTVITADGKAAKFSDYAKGKTVVLDFWATWCGPCQQAMPHYEEMHRKYAAKGVVFLGICCFDQREAYDKWVAANKDKYTFTTVFDPVGKPAAGDKAAMQKTIMMQVSGGALTPLPTTLVINAQGKFVGNYAGYGPGTHAGLANLLMLAGVELAPEDKPKTFFPAGSTVRPAAAAGGMTAAATIKPAPGSGQPEPARPATLAAGAVAPDFTMQDLAGKDVRLSDFKGKVVILDFWATWCGPCIASFPHTAKIAAQYKDQDVVVLASCTSDTRAAFEKWVPANQAKYADILFAADPHARGTPTFEQRASAVLYGVTGIPTQFVIGRDGKIVATIVGNGGEDDPRTEGALALAGVKVDAALAAKGKAALVAAAAEEKQRALDAAETAKNPPPPFFESMGRLVAGQPLPLADFTAQGPDGAPVKFSDLAHGKITVLNVWNPANAAEFLAFQEAWARKYAGQNVQFVALASYCSKEDYDKFLADQAGKFSFPLLFDPVGRFAAPAKPIAEMTVEEKKDFSTRQREHMAKVIAMQLTGGMMLPIPNNLVLDAQGRLLGGYIGAGDKSAPALGNLLHRAGVKLAPEDMPKRIYTAEETKPKAPPAKVEMLKVGALAPDFPATDVAGQPVRVSDYRGKIVILDFWATWCGPCINSMPHTNEVAAQYKDQGVVVLASCTSDTRAKFDAWVKANQARFPEMIFSHDPLEKSDDRAARKLYGVSGIPQQFIIGRDGRIAALCTGYLKGEVLLEAALAQAGVKVAPEILAKAKLDQANRDALR